MSRGFRAATMAVLLLALSSCVRLEEKPYRGSLENEPWIFPLQKVEEALELKNIGAADFAWHKAYVAALGTRRWEGMVEVGQAYLRIAEAAGVRKAAEPRARRCYMTALFRAREQGSLDGVLRVAEAFAALDDRAMVDQSFMIAQRLADQEGTDARPFRSTPVSLPGSR